MKQETILFLVVLCAFTAAMVPKERRSADAETTSTKSEICEPVTPCAWTTYDPKYKRKLMVVSNEYCKCTSTTECRESEYDKTSAAIVHRCRSPDEPNFVIS